MLKFSPTTLKHIIFCNAQQSAKNHYQKFFSPKFKAKNILLQKYILITLYFLSELIKCCKVSENVSF